MKLAPTTYMFEVMYNDANNVLGYLSMRGTKQTIQSLFALAHPGKTYISSYVEGN